MKITDDIFLVGSGLLGYNQTNEFDCNVYLLDCGSCLMLIDSGAGIKPHSIIKAIIQEGFKPEDIQYIFITHAHADHAGGTFALKQLTGAKVISSTAASRILSVADEEANSLKSARKQGIYPSDYVFRSCEVDIELKGGEQLKIGNLNFEFIATPGHSGDSLSCYCLERKSLFSGDLLFDGGKIAALTTWDFSIQALSESINTIDQLNVETILPGHFSPIISKGNLTIEKVKETFAKLEIPESIV